MLECIEILFVASQQGLHIDAVKGNWQFNGSIQSKIVAMASEIERDLISQRTKEALTAKQKIGRPSGTGKSKLDPYRLEIEALLANGSTEKFIAQSYF